MESKPMSSSIPSYADVTRQNFTASSGTDDTNYNPLLEMYKLSRRARPLSPPSSESPQVPVLGNGNRIVYSSMQNNAKLTRKIDQREMGSRSLKGPPAKRQIMESKPMSSSIPSYADVARRSQQEQLNSLGEALGQFLSENPNVVMDAIRKSS